jgi:predicted Rossmann-fold nucleotide-binding protein
MQASTEGAESVGGKTIGVTLNPNKEEMPEFEGQTAANHLTLEIKSRNYIERMFGLMTQADVFVCFRGGTGTLSEWSTAWLLAHLYYGNHKPLVLYGGFWFEVMDVINGNFMIGEKERNVYRIVENKEQLMAVIEGFEREYQVLLETKQRS